MNLECKLFENFIKYKYLGTWIAQDLESREQGMNLQQ